MNISNKFLGFSLIVALFVSVFSVLLSVPMLDVLKSTSHTTSSQGFIQVELIDQMSITTIDSEAIDFGPCELLEEENYFIISSEGTHETYVSCKKYARTNISVRNDGTIPVSVYISINEVGALHNGSFLKSPSNLSDVAFKITNAGRKGNKGGCEIEGVGFIDYVSFQTPGHLYGICEKLKTDGMNGHNSLITNFNIVVPGDIEASKNESLEIVFSAAPI